MNTRPYWGDLHNHNGIGYGKGSMERSYQIAHGSLLDVYCFTPHGTWHDRPVKDEKMAEFHRVGFEKVQAQWPRVVEKVKAEYEPGKFVSLFGFEWHSSTYGDYHSLFPSDEVELFAGDNVEDLQNHVRRYNGIMIPHHVGYRKGWRGGNWPKFDPEVSPVVDCFSEHGCSMESEFQMPMLLHSMGGSERSQTVMEQFKNGLVAGLVASTDNHHGHPASYGEGLAGFWSEELTREAIFDAFRRRHTFAVTGERIAIQFRAADAMMGDVLPANAAREFSYETDACSEIDSIRIIRNGRVVHNALPPEPNPASDRRFVARLSFGWDAMTSKDVTDWKIRLKVANGEVAEVAPTFAGGDGSVQKVNGVESVAKNEVVLNAFTSRLNPHPISEVVFRIDGDASTRLTVDVESEYREEKGGCKLEATLGELMECDHWETITDLFSAPKIRLGHAHGATETVVSGTWSDPEPTDSDWYLFRVQQKNGHTAWSSPIWFKQE